MRAATLGNLRNTLGSTSIAVYTGSPVMGHLIITELMALGPPIDLHPNAVQMELSDGMEPFERDRLKTAQPLWIKLR